MTRIAFDKAKEQLSELIDRAANGEDFVIAKAGRPMVKVVAYEDQMSIQKPVKVGFLAGGIMVPDDFDTMGNDSVRKLFEVGGE